MARPRAAPLLRVSAFCPVQGGVCRTEPGITLPPLHPHTGERGPLLWEGVWNLQPLLHILRPCGFQIRDLSSAGLRFQLVLHWFLTPVHAPEPPASTFKVGDSPPDVNAW
ncbi:unnamed protein product [Pleuronectes platessa]|uniref:Uncharacterized protein n=1 Tax=Pleuronectes platessa TaxID=8262 RepID=A0A9N7YNW1_PLEPL|nr:unnamed protein product [Pleuronectes platessa]